MVRRGAEGMREGEGDGGVCASPGSRTAMEGGGSGRGTTIYVCWRSSSRRLLHDDDGDDALGDAAADGVPTGDAASSGCAAPAQLRSDFFSYGL